MDKISSHDSAFFYKNIIKLLTKLYYPVVYKLISRCVTIESETEVTYFSTCMKQLAEKIKKSPDEEYNKFKGMLEEPVIVYNVIDNINFLHKKMFPKLYVSQEKTFQKVSQLEIFTHVILNVTREMFNNRYLFSVFEKDQLVKSMQLGMAIDLSIFCF